MYYSFPLPLKSTFQNVRSKVSKPHVVQASLSFCRWSKALQLQENLFQTTGGSGATRPPPVSVPHLPQRGGGETANGFWVHFSPLFLLHILLYIYTYFALHLLHTYFVLQKQESSALFVCVEKSRATRKRTFEVRRPTAPVLQYSESTDLVSKCILLGRNIIYDHLEEPCSVKFMRKMKTLNAHFDVLVTKTN